MLTREYDDEYRRELSSKEYEIDSLVSQLSRTRDDLTQAVRSSRQMEIEVDNSARLEEYLRDTTVSLSQKLEKKRVKVRELKATIRSTTQTYTQREEDLEEELRAMNSAILRQKESE